MLVRTVLAAAALLALAAPAAPAALVPAATSHVHIESFAFNPDPINILVGDTVEWDNHDNVAHTATADDGSFDSGTLMNGDSYRRVFNAPGSIAYHCDIHPSMTGRIVVTDPNAPPDLVVSGIAFADVTPGLAKRIDVTVRNIGDGLAGRSVVGVAYVYQGERVAIGEASIGQLGAGQSGTASVAWDTTGKVGDFDLRALADAGGDVDEADEGNNEGRAVASVLVPGGFVPGIDLLDPL